jgi:hypothetical protein
MFVSRCLPIGARHDANDASRSSELPGQTATGAGRLACEDALHDACEDALYGACDDALHGSSHDASQHARHGACRGV